MTWALAGAPCGLAALALVIFGGANARAACFAFLWIPASAGMTGLAGMTNAAGAGLLPLTDLNPL